MDQNEELINRLIQDTGCDRGLAVLLLRFTGGDVEGAGRIIRAVPKDIFALKVKFITQITGYYGAFFFCFDSKEKDLKRFIAVVTDETEIGKINVSIPWRDFEEELYDYARNKKVESLKIEQLKQRFLEKEFFTRFSKVLKPEKPVNRESLNNIIIDELYNVFADTNIAVKFNVEMTDAFELNKGQGESILEERELSPEQVEKEQAEKKKESIKDHSLVVLKVDPVLSPVSGREIREFEFGDEIQVRITDERDIADYLAELLGAKVDSIRIPIFTKIIEVKPLEGGNVGVLTQFGPGIMGMFKVPEDVKVVPRGETSNETQIEKGKKEISPFLVIGGIVVVMGLFLLLIFLTR